jgi:hypothetical protein
MGFRKQRRLLSWINPSFKKTFFDSPSRALAPLFTDFPVLILYNRELLVRILVNGLVLVWSGSQNMRFREHPFMNDVSGQVESLPFVANWEIDHVPNFRSSWNEIGSKWSILISHSSTAILFIHRYIFYRFSHWSFVHCVLTSLKKKSELRD